ncbi:unnamed protein product [Lasius platythorax]|uniref:Uncharacterized protein n=1 Tax=Lasius platythorax TaxID=488582 RepID=A0AAV2NT71_9HYME
MAGNHSRAILVLSLELEYVQLLSSRALHSLFSVRLGYPTSFPSTLPSLLLLPSFRLRRALRLPEARQFCRFKVVEVIKLLKRSLGFASFPGSPPFSGYPFPSPFTSPSLRDTQPFSSTITCNVSKE